MIFDHVKQVGAILRSFDAVSFVGICHEAKLLAGSNERVDHLNAILKVHVVVLGAVG